MVTAATLNGNYVIDRFNGAAVSDKYTVSFETIDNNAVRLHCVIANTMNGTVKLSDNVLTGIVMSTLMLGNEEEQKIESAIGKGLMEGMRVTQKGRVLLLHADNTVIRLTKA